MRIIVLVAVLGLAVGVGAAVGDYVITPSQGVMIVKPTSGTTMASCPATVVGTSQLCVAASGVYFSTGGAYVQLGTGGATVNNLTIGTKSCNLGTSACTYSISATTSAPSTTVGVN